MDCGKNVLIRSRNHFHSVIKSDKLSQSDSYDVSNDYVFFFFSIFTIRTSHISDKTSDTKSRSDVFTTFEQHKVLKSLRTYLANLVLKLSTNRITSEVNDLNFKL